jgi:toxin ParE1/3/4
MRYEVHPEALEEYREAASWYGNRATDLALRFVSEVEDAIGRILDGPERWRIIDDDVRRCLTHVFPFDSLHNRTEIHTDCRGRALCSRTRLLEGSLGSEMIIDLSPSNTASLPTKICPR